LKTFWCLGVSSGSLVENGSQNKQPMALNGPLERAGAEFPTRKKLLIWNSDLAPGLFFLNHVVKLDFLSESFCLAEIRCTIRKQPGITFQRLVQLYQRRQTAH
jgi:hypothetical protein